MTKSSNAYLILISSIVATSGLLFGFDTGNIAGALVFIEKEFKTTTFQNQIIVSITILGAFLSAFSVGKLVDKLGRGCMLKAAAILFFLGAVTCAYAHGLSEIILGRLMLGLALGISSFTAPLYIAEMSPAYSRGTFVLLNGFAITFGECIAFLCDYWLSYSENWRLMILLGTLPASVLFAGLLFMPPSPRWLILKNKKQKALEVLQLIRQKTFVHFEIREIQNSLKEKPFKLLELLQDKKLKRPLLIGVTLGILQQFSGINAIMYYGPFIFAEAGFEHHSTQIFATFILGFVNMIMTVMMMFIIDRLGRRNLLLTGLLLSGVSLLLLCGLNVISHDPTQLANLTIVLFIGFMVGFCMGIGSLFWIIIAEIFPLAHRGAAMGFATAIQWLANFMVSISFLTLLNALNIAGVFAIYGVCCIWGAWFVYHHLPETKGKSLEAIEAYWS